MRGLEIFGTGDIEAAFHCLGTAEVDSDKLNMSAIGAAKNGAPAFKNQAVLAVLASKSLLSRQPSYLRELFDVQQPSKSWKSSSQTNRLNINRSRIFFGSRALCRAAPTVWNCPLNDLINILLSVASFECWPKTHL